MLFDLQGNCKSALVTFLARADIKIGFSQNSVSEWPNLFFTDFQFEVDKKKNIREQYLSLVQTFFKILRLTRIILFIIY